MLDFLSVLEILNVNGGNVNNDTNDFGNIFISLTLFVHKIHTTNGMKKNTNYENDLKVINIIHTANSMIISMIIVVLLIC